jgi:serine/threonine protein kinase/tetratricopeptide (TPR) repeat protein
VNANSERIIELFSQAMAKESVEERARFLAESCPNEPDVREQVESLLRAAEPGRDFLKQTPCGSRAIASLVTERPGDRIGRYKLLEQIGEGGCGVVYMAEQEEPVRRRVALKVIKLGMDTQSVIARFEAERQALALMDHPHIAKVLDAGASDAGRPYFVMELVRGLKITDYCDENNLRTEQRLNLFLQVCQAIQHAHQKGIIHRDIKPSNVLVADHDGVPVPKIIDFGIAKATADQRLTDKTLFTALEQFMGTPAYMSPEQAKLSGLDIDTRSDIYSLGVLLYELLTGKTPFDARELLAAGLDEMRRIIREVDPVKPSTRLSQVLVAADVRRRTSKSEIRNPKSEIDQDLDWIVMKCLEKDRTRRYETANGLARDIERQLNNEPVVARPPSNLYRFQKLVRRNKVAFAASAAIAIVLMVCVVVSTWQAIRATRAEREQSRLREAAQTEANKSQQVARFLKDMLQGVGPAKARGRDTAMLRQILDETAKRVGTYLTNQPAVEAELRNTLGEVYFALGAYGQARAMHNAALVLRKKVLGSEHPDVAQSLHGLALALLRQDKLADAETSAREALSLRRKLFGNEHQDVASSALNLAVVLLEERKLAEAETLTREALATRRKVLANDHLDVATGLNTLANVLSREGKLPDAETSLREALVIRKKWLGDVHPELAVSLNDLALLLQEESKLAEAEALYLEALAVGRAVYGEEHPELATTLANLSMLHRKQNRLAEAEKAARDALEMRRRLLGQEHSLVANSLSGLGVVLRDQGRLAEAEALQRKAVEMQKKLAGVEHSEVAVFLTNLADVLDDQRKLAEAEGAYTESLAILRKVYGREHPQTAHVLNGLGVTFQKQGKLAEAETTLNEALVVMRKFLGNEHTEIAFVLNNLASINDKQGRPAEAERLYREALPMGRKLLGGEHPLVAALLGNLGRLLQRAGRLAEAEPLLRECLSIREKKQPDDWRLFNTRSLLGTCLLGQKQYVEAESLLVSGYEGLKQREDKIPAEGRPRLKEILQRLVELYDASSQPEKAAAWKQKLAELNAAELKKKAAAEPEK